jgi:Leucine rich repeat
VGIGEVIEQVMYDPQRLEWLDISHNLLATVDEGLLSLVNLKSLYLHANKICAFKEVDKLSALAKLQTITLHANPIAKSLLLYRQYCLGMRLRSVAAPSSEIGLGGGDQKGVG